MKTPVKKKKERNRGLDELPERARLVETIRKSLEKKKKWRLCLCVCLCVSVCVTVCKMGPVEVGGVT